jgi:hypothetical protein
MAVMPEPNWGAAYTNIGAASGNYRNSLSAWYDSYRNTVWDSTNSIVSSLSATWSTSTLSSSISVAGVVSAENITLSNAVLITGTFKSTGYFYTFNINGSALYLPLYKLST